jgi:hypothetical protein
MVKEFNAGHTKQTRATRTKAAEKVIPAATGTKRSTKRKNATKPSPRQVKLREDALLEVMQGDVGIVVADDYTMRHKRLVTAASKTKVGTPVLQAWTEMKHAIDTTKILHRQRILTAQHLHRACCFTPHGSDGFYSG